MSIVDSPSFPDLSRKPRAPAVHVHRDGPPLKPRFPCHFNNRVTPILRPFRDSCRGEPCVVRRVGPVACYPGTDEIYDVEPFSDETPTHALVDWPGVKPTSVEPIEDCVIYEPPPEPERPATGPALLHPVKEGWNESLGIQPWQVEAGQGIPGETYRPDGAIYVSNRAHFNEITRKLGYEETRKQNCS